ncbi:hypothetical protein EV673_1412 [Limnobacter thiooxidans]|uniref:Uncharacterized protein n=1 Tax=Limnobacter thiooxidans TaxID=131080 RepID=A0AA86MCD2_9BURK|nr:hypothetical protein EV673_1412 [Limnobacter thiooxidans]BET24716.1 hypothetical protein RGQ30_02170 [Limnobacter thiooxidans]
MELVCQSKLRLDGLKTADLEKYEGLDIKDICSTGLDSAGLNHCAHFVSHALDLGFGMLCGNMSWDTKGQGGYRFTRAIFSQVQRTVWVKNATLLWCVGQ